MKKSIKRTLLFSFLMVIIAVVWIYYLLSRPVNIIATHRNPYSFHLLVDHFPFTAKGRISWWLNNKKWIMEKYNLPDDILTEKNIAVWAFGDGYKELGKYDRLCFQDMPPPKNCIEKERLMYITLTRNGEVSYWLNNTRYIQKKNGELDEKGFD
ncbi:hypothetical protein C7M52_02714 [Mixta theicola]|nr:DUF943 family protein [Mixta theicola]QHM76731.1 hypothetical protein C7M52_02714 [Mixta theicola]